MGLEPVSPHEARVRRLVELVEERGFVFDNDAPGPGDDLELPPPWFTWEPGQPEPERAVKAPPKRQRRREGRRSA